MFFSNKKKIKSCRLTGNNLVGFFFNFLFVFRVVFFLGGGVFTACPNFYWFAQLTSRWNQTYAHMFDSMLSFSLSFDFILLFVAIYHYESQRSILSARCNANTFCPSLERHPLVLYCSEFISSAPLQTHTQMMYIIVQLNVTRPAI